jgi:hypothetical protein
VGWTAWEFPRKIALAAFLMVEQHHHPSDGGTDFKQLIKRALINQNPCTYVNIFVVHHGKTCMVNIIR